MPLVSRTRATLRSAEFGFLGVFVYTRVHTPRRCGAPLRAAVLPLSGLSSRPLRTSCWMVGTALQVRGYNGSRPSYGGRVPGATGPPWVASPREAHRGPRPGVPPRAVRAPDRGRARGPADGDGGEGSRAARRPDRVEHQH